jgi:hypothetical protein
MLISSWTHGHARTISTVAENRNHAVDVDERVRTDLSRSGRNKSVCDHVEAWGLLRPCHETGNLQCRAVVWKLEGKVSSGIPGVKRAEAPDDGIGS